MDEVNARRSPQKIKDYDRDLRRVRQMQQLQAEQDAKIRAQGVKTQKKPVVQPVEKEKKKPLPKPKTTSSTAASSLSMANFSTPSYR